MKQTVTAFQQRLQTQSSDENSARPFVKHVICDKMEDL